MGSDGDAMLDIDFDPNALRDRYRSERDRRLRPDGNAQYVEIKGDFSHYIDDPTSTRGSLARH